MRDCGCGLCFGGCGPHGDGSCRPNVNSQYHRAACRQKLILVRVGQVHNHPRDRGIGLKQPDPNVFYAPRIDKKIVAATAAHTRQIDDDALRIRELHDRRHDFGTGFNVDLYGSFATQDAYIPQHRDRLGDRWLGRRASQLGMKRNRGMVSIRQRLRAGGQNDAREKDSDQQRRPCPAFWLDKNRSTPLPGGGRGTPLPLCGIVVVGIWRGEGLSRYPTGNGRLPRYRAPEEAEAAVC